MKNRAKSTGTVERGVPPQLPQPEWLHSCLCAQPNTGLLRLSLCQATEPVTLKSGGVTDLPA